MAAYVETHKRPLTDAQLRDIEIVPRKHYEYRGANFEEMDLEAVLERHPEVALVDELAHTNAPGSTHDKRWQDVEALLEAGIDVITNPSAGGQPFYACASGHNAASSNAIWGDNYTRMTNFLAVTIVAGGTGQFVGQPITPTLLRQEKAVIDNSLRNMKDAVPPMIADYQTTFVQTPTQQDNGIVIIQALVKYLAIEEKLVVALQGGQTVDIQRQGTGA